MHLAHHPDAVALLRTPTAQDPWRVLVSACLAGEPCGVDGSDYGAGAIFAALLALPTVRAVPFCPERYRMGVPRTMPDIHGGDGFAVLDGQARVVDEHGTDLTEPMVAGAEAMLALARERRVDLAILMDMSAACGSQVISDGCRLVPVRRFVAGVGVATAALLRGGIPVVAQRDAKTLGQLRARLEPGWIPPADARDYHETEWYLATFGG